MKIFFKTFFTVILVAGAIYSTKLIGQKSANKPLEHPLSGGGWIWENINTVEHDEIMPIVSPDGQHLYFLKSIVDEDKLGPDGEYMPNSLSQEIYKSTWNKEKQMWSSPVRLPEPFNIQERLGTCVLFSITPDGHTALMFGGINNRPISLTRQEDFKPEEDIMDMLQGGGDFGSIYERLEEISKGPKVWVEKIPKPHAFGLINISQSGWSTPEWQWIRGFSHQLKVSEYVREIPEAYLANDKKTMILGLGGGKDNLGKMDLYVSFALEDDTWSKPKHLGKKINSEGMEMTPFLASDGKTLYFASDAHPGYGGFDLFYSKRLDNSWENWSPPVNLGQEINSDFDEVSLSIPASGKYAYYSSDRIVSEDIYRIEIPKELAPEPTILIKGMISEKITGEPLFAEVIYEDLSTGEEVGRAISNPTTGLYQITLPKGKIYGFQAESEGYYGVSENLNVVDLNSYKELERNLVMVPIDGTDTPILLNNIFFDFDEAKLLATSFPELRRVQQLMKENPTIQVQIQGHTDADGSLAYNQDLSERRASAVKAFLVQEEIGSNRIATKGYGKTKPVADNETEEGRALNRRVEFVISRK